MNYFREIFNAVGNAAIATMPFSTSENVICVFIKNASGASITLTLQAGVEEGNALNFYNVVDPYAETPVTVVAVSGTTNVRMLSGVPTGVQYRFISASGSGVGGVIIKTVA